MLSIGLLFVGLAGVVLINAALPSVKISNAIRADDAKEILNSLDWHNFIAVPWYKVIFGHGFGAAILGRQAIEITYANLFYKQGLMAILFWLFSPVYLVWRIRNILDERFRSVAIPFLMSTALVYLVSLFNPFLSNPIGMSVVMISMVAVRVISEADRMEAMVVPNNGEQVMFP
jgi:hypothetical protein